MLALCSDSHDSIFISVCNVMALYYLCPMILSSPLSTLDYFLTIHSELPFCFPVGVYVCVPKSLISIVYMSMGERFFGLMRKLIDGYITEENVSSPLATIHCVWILMEREGFHELVPDSWSFEG